VGIHNAPGLQAILIDTPGMLLPRGRLHQAMVQVARACIGEADLVCWVVDAADIVERNRKKPPAEWSLDRGMEAVHEAWEQAGRPPLVVALNKIDRSGRAWVLPVIQLFAAKLPEVNLVPICARDGNGISELVEVWRRHMPEAPAVYPVDQVTDQPERFFVGELIREKVFLLCGEEVPYATAVEVESFIEEPGPSEEARGRITIHAKILVERDGQKGILIGEGGRMLKEIGTRARRDIQELLGARVHLELHVSVHKGWSENMRVLREQGITG
jgi:GTP-binding protein Era